MKKKYKKQNGDQPSYLAHESFCRKNEKEKTRNQRMFTFSFILFVVSNLLTIILFCVIAQSKVCEKLLNWNEKTQFR